MSLSFKKPSIKKLLIVLVVVFGFMSLGFWFFDDSTSVKKPPSGLSGSAYKDWVADNVYEGIYTHDAVDFGYQVPTEKELQTLRGNSDLTRKYPKRINAIFEIGANTATLLHLDEELKDMGVNTYFVQAEYELKGGKVKLFQPGYGSVFSLSQDEAKRAIKHRFLIANEKGFATVFIPDYPSFFNFGKEKYDLEKLEPQYIDVALEWAKAAEEYGVEYFVPINEYEKLLESNGYDMNFIYKKTNAFYEKLLPELRKVYSGKIIMKTGHLGDWENHKNLDHSDADLFGVGTFYARDKESIRQDVADMVRVADQISARDNTPWLVTEFLVATPEDIERDFAGKGVRIDMKDAYEAGLSEMRKSTRAVGFTFSGHIGTGKVRGTGAVSLLKAFFNR